MNKQDREKFENLMRQLLDGELSDEQLGQLGILLSENPSARKEYVAMLTTHAALEDELGRVPLPASSSQDPSSTTLYARAAQQLANILKRPTPFSIAVAAMFIGVVLTTMAFMVPGFYGGKDTRSNPRAPIVARLTQLHGAEWEDPNQAIDIGTFLAKGRKLQLKKGLVEIQFNRGATVTVEGPASCALIAADRLELNQGQIVARVTPQGVGFVVETEAARITDLGTEFGVVADAFGDTKAYVFKGRVSLDSKQTPQDEAHVLAAGQGATVSTDGAIHALNAPPKLVHDVQMRGVRGQTQPFASYQYLGKNSDPRTAIHAAFGDEGYPDDDRRKLIDSRIGSRNHHDGNWVGWYDEAEVVGSAEPQPAIVLDAGKVVALQDLHIAYLAEHHLAIHAPDSVVISTSQDGKSYQAATEFREFRNDWSGQRRLGNGAVRIATVPLGGVKSRFVRLEFFNDQQWTFLSEVRYLPSPPVAPQIPSDTPRP